MSQYLISSYDLNILHRSAAVLQKLAHAKHTQRLDCLPFTYKFLEQLSSDTFSLYEFTNELSPPTVKES
jgi:hypothetical protein